MLPRRTPAPRPRRRLFVAFVLGGERRVLPVEAVAGVGELGPVTALPTADPARLGVTVHQGRVIALVAASPAAGAPGPGGYLVLLRQGAGDVGFAVEELLGLEVHTGPGLPPGFALLATDFPTDLPGDGDAP